MSSSLFNSLSGYSVGIPPKEVISTTGNVVTNVNYPQGNVSANAVYANSYRYANGEPFNTSAAGSNGQLQFNNSSVFGGVPGTAWNGNILLLGNISSVSIGGGENGYFLQTDGQGNLSWVVGSGGGGNGNPGGMNTQVQFNNSGVFGGSPNFVFNNSTNTLTIQNITSTGNVDLDSATLSVGSVSNVYIPGGSNGYVLTTDGSGNLSWTSGGASSPGGSNGEIQFNNSGSFGASQFLTFNANTTTLNISGNLVANTITIGSGVYEFSSTKVFFATTNSTTVDQVLYSVNSSDVSGLDITIIATDSTSGSRQISKMAVVTLAASATYNEYSSLFVNTQVGDFKILYNPGNIIVGPKIELVVTPASSNNTVYKMTITAYKP